MLTGKATIAMVEATAQVRYNTAISFWEWRLVDDDTGKVIETGLVERGGLPAARGRARSAKIKWEHKDWQDA